MKKSFIAFSVLVIIGCADDKKNDYFPVVGYILAQVNHVDTSVYGIIKVVTVDSTSDTTYVKREEFRALAQDFLETPDLTRESIGKKYQEEKFYDEGLNRVIFTYTPIKKAGEVLSQQITVIPTQAETDQVKSIVIEKMKRQNGNDLHQRLLWQVDESFQIVDIIEKDGKVISKKKTDVIWNRPKEVVDSFDLSQPVDTFKMK